MLRENWFGSKFAALWILKTCSKFQSNGPLYVEKCLLDYDFQNSQYLLRFPKAIAFSLEKKFFRLKISCNMDKFKLNLMQSNGRLSDKNQRCNNEL